jgi:hypothetical protein
MWSWPEGVFQSLNIAQALIGIVTSAVTFISVMHGVWRKPAYGPQHVQLCLLALAAYCGSEIFIVTVVTTLTGRRPFGSLFPSCGSFAWPMRNRVRGGFSIPSACSIWVLVAAIAVLFALAPTARASCLNLG